MLGPDSNFQEAQALRNNTDTPASISLPGDDASAILMLLQAAHLPNHLLPRKITVDEFYELAIVCDKYDTAKVMVLWAIVWMGSGGNLSDTRWLVIAWVFRDRHLFTKVTGQFVLNTRLDGDNKLVIRGARIDNPLVPESVIGLLLLRPTL